MWARTTTADDVSLSKSVTKSHGYFCHLTEGNLSLDSYMINQCIDMAYHANFKNKIK